MIIVTKMYEKIIENSEYSSKFMQTMIKRAKVEKT